MCVFFICSSYQYVMFNILIMYMRVLCTDRSGSSVVSVLSNLSAASGVSGASGAGKSASSAFAIEGLDHALLSRGTVTANSAEGLTGK